MPGLSASNDWQTMTGFASLLVAVVVVKLIHVAWDGLERKFGPVPAA